MDLTRTQFEAMLAPTTPVALAVNPGRETAPGVVPLTPTISPTLADAIRLGATTGPQAFGRLRGPGGATCALGAAAEGRAMLAKARGLAVGGTTPAAAEATRRGIAGR